MLERVRPLLEELVVERQALRQHQELLAEFQTRARGNGGVARGPATSTAAALSRKLTYRRPSSTGAWRVSSF